METFLMSDDRRVASGVAHESCLHLGPGGHMAMSHLASVKLEFAGDGRAHQSARLHGSLL